MARQYVVNGTFVQESPGNKQYVLNGVLVEETPSLTVSAAAIGTLSLSGRGAGQISSLVQVAARIAFILEEFRTAISEDESVKGIFGNLARQSDDPIVTFFDDVDDAQKVAAARQALLGSPTRRRFDVSVTGVDDVLALDHAGTIPVARYIDTERDCDRSMLVCALSVDLSRDSATLTVWG